MAAILFQLQCVIITSCSYGMVQYNTILHTAQQWQREDTMHGMVQYNTILHTAQQWQREDTMHGMVQYNTILHTAQQWQREDPMQTLNSQNTPLITSNMGPTWGPPGADRLYFVICCGRAVGCLSCVFFIKMTVSRLPLCITQQCITPITHCSAQDLPMNTKGILIRPIKRSCRLHRCIK